MHNHSYHEKDVVFCYFILSVGIAYAQTRQISFEQAFKSVPTNISCPLPAIKGWVDDEHYIQMMTDQKDGKSKWMSVEVKSGTAVPYNLAAQTASSVTSKAYGLDSVQNFTASPDGKWAAYSKKNDLYAMELASKNIVRLTSDGNDSILNGYASWVYYEEILGRASHYKAFWWSPDSKQIAFMRFDDSNVPVFPLYVADGQHGYLEQERYPKAGDRNPEVKIGSLRP